MTEKTNKRTVLVFSIAALAVGLFLMIYSGLAILSILPLAPGSVGRRIPFLIACAVLGLLQVIAITLLFIKNKSLKVKAIVAGAIAILALPILFFAHSFATRNVNLPEPIEDLFETYFSVWASGNAIALTCLCLNTALIVFASVILLMKSQKAKAPLPVVVPVPPPPLPKQQLQSQPKPQPLSNPVTQFEPKKLMPAPQHEPTSKPASKSAPKPQTKSQPKKQKA